MASKQRNDHAGLYRSAHPIGQRQNSELVESALEGARHLSGVQNDRVDGSATRRQHSTTCDRRCRSQYSKLSAHCSDVQKLCSFNVLQRRPNWHFGIPPCAVVHKCSHKPKSLHGRNIWRARAAKYIPAARSAWFFAEERQVRYPWHLDQLLETFHQAQSCSPVTWAAS
jgi:hypothetical protein